MLYARSVRIVRWLCGIALALGTVTGTRAASAADVTVAVLEDTPSRTVLRFRVHHYQLVPVTVNGQPFVRVLVAREASALEAGAPELPAVTRSILVGNDAHVEAKILATSHHDTPNVDVVPSKGNLLRAVDPATVPYTFGESYQKDAFHPAAIVSVGEPYLMRERRGVAVTVRPFQFHPQKRVLRVLESVTVEVARVGTSTVNVLQKGPSGSSATFHRLAARHFLNHGTRAAYAPLDEEGGMLVIAHDAWLPNVAPLVAHKESIGIETTAVGVSTVGNSASSIKSYIQSQYDAGNLAFVLLVGDAAQVATPYASGGAADPTYAKVAGDDAYPDIFVGRFSATKPEHVDTQVARTIAYESEQATQQAWFKKAMGIGSYEGPGDDGEYDHEHIDKIGQLLAANGYTHVDKFYGGSADSGDVVAALNEGRGLINYAGHGSPTSFGTTGFSNGSVPYLQNAGKLPFVVSVACNTGEFDTGTSLGEAMLRATSGGAPTGAIGMYASSISQSWNPPMAAQDEMAEVFVAGSYWSLGAISFAGSAKMIDEYGSGGVAMFNTWHLFGDPSVRVVGTVKPASGLRVSPEDRYEAQGPKGGPFDPGTMVYTLENGGDAPIDFSVASKAAWLTVSPGQGTLAGKATAQVTVALGDAAASLPNGHYQGVIFFVNETDHEGDTERPASLTVGEPELVHDFPLDTDPGWTTEGGWAYGQPTGQGTQELGFADPTAGHTGAYVYGYELDGDYPNNLPERHLTTGAIDCSELSKVELRFWRWLNVEGPQYDHAYVRASTDGAMWQTVWENGADVTDSAWTEVKLDLSAIADGQPSLYVRWTMGTTDEGLVATGWNLDDVQIWGLKDTCSGADADADGDGVPGPACGGPDCNDADATIYPGAQEICGDGIDQNCDGSDACDGGGEGPAVGGPAGDADGGAADTVFGACGCRVVGTPRAPGATLALFALLVALGMRRRRVA